MALKLTSGNVSSRLRTSIVKQSAQAIAERNNTADQTAIYLALMRDEMMKEAAEFALQRVRGDKSFCRLEIKKEASVLTMYLRLIREETARFRSEEITEILDGITDAMKKVQELKPINCV